MVLVPARPAGEWGELRQALASDTSSCFLKDRMLSNSIDRKPRGSGPKSGLHALSCDASGYFRWLLSVSNISSQYFAQNLLHGSACKAESAVFRDAAFWSVSDLLGCRDHKTARSVWLNLHLYH